MLIDAKKGFTRQDKSIVDEVINNGRGLVLIVNKWDLVTKDSSSAKIFRDKITRKFKSLRHYPIIFLLHKATYSSCAANCFKCSFKGKTENFYKSTKRCATQNFTKISSSIRPRKTNTN